MTTSQLEKPFGKLGRVPARGPSIPRVVRTSESSTPSYGGVMSVSDLNDLHALQASNEERSEMTVESRYV